MPIVNGVDAAHAIQRITPDLAIVLMSGAVPAYYADGIERLRLAGMLHKLFPMAALRELIRDAVGDGVAIEPE
jgi:DNA-binding NarL/FixJ family response regulator